MPENPLVKKMRLKPETRIAIVGAPPGYLEALQPLPVGIELHDRLEGQFDWIQVFVRDKAELDAIAMQALQALKPVSLLWISFPKGTSKIQTDLTRDRGWDILTGQDYKWTNLISVNADWSAFSLRPYQPGEARKSFR